MSDPDMTISMLMDRVEELEAAIRTHREQKADDRCIEDDDRLYAALGDGVKCDRRVGDKAEMLRNCARFIERRCQGGEWPSYAELEARLAAVRVHEVRLARSEGSTLGMPMLGDMKIVVEGFEPRIYDFDGESWKERAT